MPLNTNGIFLAVGEDAVRISSPDGRTWSGTEASEKVKAKEAKKSWDGGGSFWGITVAEGRAVAVGPFGSNGGIRSSTTDGRDWSTVEITEKQGRLLDVAYGDGRFVAVGSGVPNYIEHWWSTSEDGSDWKPVSEMHRKEHKGAGGLIRIAYGNGVFVALGRTGKFGLSDDGDTWTFHDHKPAIDHTFLDIIFANGVFLGVGLHGLRRTSTDGKDWSDPQRGPEGEHISSAVWTGERFVGVAPGATYLSPDGKAWERVPNTNAPTVIAYGNGIFAGARYRGELLVSDDAVRWESVHRIEQDIRAMDFLPL